MDDLTIAKAWVLTALVVIVFVFAIMFGSDIKAVFGKEEVVRDWIQDCYGTRVTVEQLGVAHFQVFCNGLVVDPYDIKIRTFYETFGNWQGPPQVGPPVPTTTVETD